MGYWIYNLTVSVYGITDVSPVCVNNMAHLLSGYTQVYMYSPTQDSKLMLANLQNAIDFDKLPVTKIFTSKHLRVGIIHVSQNIWKEFASTAYERANHSVVMNLYKCNV